MSQADEFCPRCGAKVPEKDNAQSVTNIITFFSVFVVGLLCVALVLMVLKDDSPTHSYDEPVYDEYEVSISDALITMQEFQSLQTGMSYERCVQIINGYGQKTSEMSIGDITTTTYSWEGYGSIGASATLTFSNNQLYSKVQYGLR